MATIEHPGATEHVSPPPDAALLHAALVRAAIAEGVSRFQAPGPRLASVTALLDILRACGVRIDTRGELIEVHGHGLRGLRPPTGSLDAGGSLRTLVTAAAVLAGQNFPTTLTASGTLTRRSLQRYVDALLAMGASATTGDRGTAPLRIAPARLHGIKHAFPFPNAILRDVVTIAALFATGTTRVEEPGASRNDAAWMLGLPGATATADPQECLDLESIATRMRSPSHATVPGGFTPAAESLRVPRDPLPALYAAVAAAARPGNETVAHDMPLHPLRLPGFAVLRAMGADVTMLEAIDNAGVAVCDVRVRGGAPLHVVPLDAALVARLGDELPALALAAACAEGTLVVRGAMNMRQRECDRIAAIVENLCWLGIETEELDDGFVVHGAPGSLHGGEIETFGDPTIAMFCTITARIAPGVIIHDGTHRTADSTPPEDAP